MFTKVIGSKVKKESPKVSIIIPNYNTAKSISETLDSVLAQTFQDYEIIVINDASPDTELLKEVLADYFDQIVFIDKDVNEGTSKTRNTAVNYAHGEIIAFLDADDIWFPTYLQEQIYFLEQNHFDMVYADAELFGIGSKTGKTFLDNNPEQGEITRRIYIEGKCHILPTGTLIKKEKFLAVGGFDPNVARTEDFDLWMRLLFNNTRIGYLRKVLFKFRVHPGSGSGDYLQRIERCINIWHVLRGKLEFTNEENKIIDRHLLVWNTYLLRAKGMLYIKEEKWQEAREVFTQALNRAKELNLPLKHRLKLYSILSLLKIKPDLLLTLFKQFRSEELELM